MKELKEKIICLRYLKILFYLFFITGASLFVIFTVFQTEYFVRNALISLVIMTFGYISAELSNYKIKEFLTDYKCLKCKKITNKTNIIEFDKIAW